MEFMLFFLSVLEMVLMCVYWFTAFCFRLRRALPHRMITSFLIVISQIVEIILKVMSGQNFVVDIIMLILWGLIFGWTMLQSKVLKMQDEAKEKDKEKNQL